jgi:hypothetical protein
MAKRVGKTGVKVMFLAQQCSYTGENMLFPFLFCPQSILVVGFYDITDWCIKTTRLRTRNTWW